MIDFVVSHDMGDMDDLCSVEDIDMGDMGDSTNFGKRGDHCHIDVMDSMYFLFMEIACGTRNCQSNFV